ncbi:MAG: PEGA domain-containing protein [Acidobacteriota bacterium]|nr:PEGA domain-containing protein [Acidobacteriota bacterium]
MKLRHTLTALVLLALTVAMAAPARADQDDHHDRDRRDRQWQRDQRHDRDRRDRDHRDRDDRAVPYQRYDRNWYRRDDDRPFVRIVPPAVVVNPYRVYPWWSGGQRFSLGLYIGTALPFRWVAPPPVFAGAAYGAYGAVTLNLHPDDALVYVDGHYVGRVEDFDGPGRPLTLMAGRHAVYVQARGYQPMQFWIDVDAGQMIPYRGDLVRRW